MDLFRAINKTPLQIARVSMLSWSRSLWTVLLMSMLSVCTYGLRVDISRLAQIRRPFILDKRVEATCTENPCPSWQPFLCKSSSVCIALDAVCDNHPDCPDHFDEDEELCNARRRPSVEAIYDFLEANEKWMKQKLFSGADLELVAHGLAVGRTIEDFSMMVGLTPSAETNLQDAFYGVLDNDMRPLLKLGMPKGEWFDVSDMLTKIYEGGFDV